MKTNRVFSLFTQKFQMTSQYQMNHSAQMTAGGISPAGTQFTPNAGGVRQTSPYQQHGHPAGSMPRPTGRASDQSSLGNYLLVLGKDVLGP